MSESARPRFKVRYSYGDMLGDSSVFTVSDANTKTTITIAPSNGTTHQIVIFSVTSFFDGAGVQPVTLYDGASKIGHAIAANTIGQPLVFPNGQKLSGTATIFTPAGGGGIASYTTVVYRDVPIKTSWDGEA